MNIPRISIIIPVFNAEKTIKACVNAVLHQNVGESELELEVIVVDDGSTDATADIVKSFDRVKYFRQENFGPAAARNAGALQATGSIFCFIDSDCYPCSDWLKTILSYMNFSEVDVLTGTYGIANVNLILARCIHHEILYRHQNLMGDWIDVFGSYNVIFRREIFEKIGGFDVSYRMASGEDNDLSYRLKKVGYRIRFAKDVIVDHEHPTQVWRYLSEQFRHGFWRAKLYRMHPQMIRGDGYTFMKDALEIPFSVGLFSAAVLIFFGLPLALFAVVILVMLVFECFYAFKFGIRNFFENIFFSIVMFMRSFARSAGLIWGFLRC